MTKAKTAPEKTPDGPEPSGPNTFFEDVASDFGNSYLDVLMGFNQTHNITSVIGLTSNREGRVEMPEPEWYRNYSDPILRDRDSRESWRKIVSCYYDEFRLLRPCISKHGNEKVSRESESS